MKVTYLSQATYEVLHILIRRTQQKVCHTIFCLLDLPPAS
jgi:hypothetical protein